MAGTDVYIDGYRMKKDVFYKIILMSMVALQLPFLQAAKTTADVDYANFMKEAGKPNAQMEKVSALLRMILVPVQAYTDSYKKLSPRAQAGVNIATSVARLANYYARFSNGVDDYDHNYSKNLSALYKRDFSNGVWALYDLGDCVCNCWKFITNSALGRNLIGSDDFLIGRENIVADVNPKIVQQFTGLFDTMPNDCEDASCESRYAMLRLLAASVEGITSCWLSFTTEMRDCNALKARLSYARACARSIERSCTVNTKFMQITMAVLASYYLLSFSHACISDYYAHDTEDSADMYAKVVLRYGSYSGSDSFKRYCCRVLSEKRCKKIFSKLNEAQELCDWAKAKNGRLLYEVSVKQVLVKKAFIEANESCIETAKDQIKSEKKSIERDQKAIEKGVLVSMYERYIKKSKENIKRHEDKIVKYKAEIQDAKDEIMDDIPIGYTPGKFSLESFLDLNSESLNPNDEEVAS